MSRLAHGRRLRCQSGLNIRAGLRLRMRTKTPAGDRARCLRSALGGPYPDTKLPEISRVPSGGYADSLTMRPVRVDRSARRRVLRRCGQEQGKIVDGESQFWLAARRRRAVRAG